MGPPRWPRLRARILLLLVLLLASPAPARAAGPDLKGIADRIAAEHIPVKDGQIVLVQGDLGALDFLDELAVAVVRHGGSPIVHVTREKLLRRMYDEVPKEHDEERHAGALLLADSVDAIIRVELHEHPGLLDGVPQDRLATAAKARAEVASILRDRSVPLLVIGNGLWPTASAAKLHGIPVADLSRAFWAAMAVPPEQLRRDADAIKAVVAGGKQVRITHRNGTDLTFSVEERPVLVSDGTCAPENLNDDVVETHLPAGEVIVAPVRESAKGRLVVERMPFEGGWLEQFSLTFDKGRVVRHHGKPGRAYEKFKKQYDAAPELGRDELAILDIGVNRGARTARGRPLLSPIPAGTVTVGIGNNTRGGGETDIPFSFLAPLTGATVTVDGKVVVKNGELVVGGGAGAKPKAASGAAKK